MNPRFILYRDKTYPLISRSWLLISMSAQLLYKLKIKTLNLYIRTGRVRSSAYALLQVNSAFSPYYLVALFFIVRQVFWMILDLIGYVSAFLCKDYTIKIMPQCSSSIIGSPNMQSKAILSFIPETSVVSAM